MVNDFFIFRLSKRLGWNVLQEVLICTSMVILSNSNRFTWIQDIMKLVSESMSSSSWQRKQQAALTVKDLADTVGSSMGKFISPCIELLTSNIPGRYWSGKVEFCEYF